MSALELLSELNQEKVVSDKDADNRSLLAFLRKQPRQPDDMLRLFDRSATYTLHGRDADTVATEYFKSSACVRYSGTGEDRHPYLTINKNMGREIIRTALLNQRRRIEVYAFERGEWHLERRGSPGNLQAFEEECESRDLSADTSPVIVSVKLGRPAASKGGAGGTALVGVAFVDCTVRSIRVSEFEDDEHLSTLESLICQQGAREFLLPAEAADAERAKLVDVSELCEVPTTAARKGAFSRKDVEQDVRRLLGQHELHGRAFESAEQLGLAAACGLISYLDLMANVETHGLWTVEWVEPSQFMRLDSGAMRALSVEPQPNDADKNASLLGLFSVCKTAMGARLLRRWLKQPLLSRHEIQGRHDVVDALVKGYETRSLLRDEVLPKMGGDLDKLGRAFQARKAGLKEVVALYGFVRALPRLAATLEAHGPLATSDDEAALIARRFTTPVAEAVANFENLLRLVESAVDLGAAQRYEYVLQPHFTVELQEYHAAKEEVEGRIEAHYGALVKACETERDVLRLERDPRFGHCLRVTRNNNEGLQGCKAFKSGKVKLSMLQTKKDGVLYQDSTLASLSEEYTEAAKAYEAEQKTLASKVIDTAATFTPVVVDCHTLIAELDVLLAFAHVSTSAPEMYVRPTILPVDDPRPRVVLKGCRHPCVERMDGVGFIKNDVCLVRGESSLEVVTGPNMGGKSTYIRSAGVNVLLAQVGCFVPCDEAELSITDCILARVGAGDCQSRGVSTFMAEMLETATILKGATPSSLVIIDELGRGTSTYDGFGLAWAIAEHLAGQIGCCGLFATHFHELTELAAKHVAVRNRHVAAHIEDGHMTMLYKVQDGASDRAFGIHVAQVAQFPPEVVLAAKRKLSELEASDVLPAADDGAADGGAADCGKRKAPAATDAATGRPARTRAVVSTREREEGVGHVRGFLDAFRALPFNTMSDEDACNAVRELAAKMRAEPNPVVAAVCAPLPA